MCNLKEIYGRLQARGVDRRFSTTILYATPENVPYKIKSISQSKLN
jgi:hypothetical protein